MVVKRKNGKQSETLAVEFTGLAFVCVGVIIFLALISFSPKDPTFLNSITVSRIRSTNLMGNFGAQLSAILLQLFGYASYLFPVFFLITAMVLLQKKSFGPILLQLPFFLLETLVIAVLFAVVLSDFVLIASVAPLDYVSAGGIIGNNIKGWMLPALNTWGTLILLLFLLIAFFMLATRLGISVIIAAVAKAFLDAARSFSAVFKKIGRELRMVKKKKAVIRQMDSEKKHREKIRQKIKSKELPPISQPVPQDTDEKNNPLDIAIRTGLLPISGKPYNPPWRDIFANPDPDNSIDRHDLSRKSSLLVKKLEEFKVTGRVVNIHPGPIVTTYEFKMDPGIKYNKVLSLAQDLSIALSAESIRIDRTPKKPTIGIEVPNDNRRLIVLKEILETGTFLSAASPLTIVLGKTITGTPIVTSLDKMPHLLVAGQTGSGKSVGLNAILCSLLIRNTPEMVKLIMVDPKMVELGVYGHIPHLLTDVITDPKEAASALSWAVGEMERRYLLLKDIKVRSLAKYNAVVQAEFVDDEKHKPMPYIVIVIDEMADLIMTARAQVEESIARLAQKARAVGVHLIVATQRPSRDIITGVIKSNLTSRICYRVAQMIDSRIVLDQVGAEQLLGRGDMLFLPPGTSNLIRIHSPMVTEKEVNGLVSYLKSYGKPVYMNEIKSYGADDDDEGGFEIGDGDTLSSNDREYIQAVKLIVATGHASVSYLQRKMSIGYNKAARYIDMMEHDGIVGPPAQQGGKTREILVDIGFVQRLKELDS
ncbi:MAG: cell division protein FtsK [Acidobacteria bacterium CG_4_9_14_3_um_filter_49_7]|nr:MAG: cell division protein FtsK [Acidobacteria bacterium CG_4_9_14_3_um_filter_49_7]